MNPITVVIGHGPPLAQPRVNSELSAALSHKPLNAFAQWYVGHFNYRQDHVSRRLAVIQRRCDRIGRNQICARIERKRLAARRHGERHNHNHRHIFKLECLCGLTHTMYRVPESINLATCHPFAVRRRPIQQILLPNSQGSQNQGVSAILSDSAGTLWIGPGSEPAVRVKQGFSPMAFPTDQLPRAGAWHWLKINRGLCGSCMRADCSELSIIR